MNEFGLVKPPIGVVGDPTRIYECEVVTVNVDTGTVSVQKRNSRAGRQDVAVPVGYTPVEGDRVLIADIDGDRRKPIIVQVLTSGYVAPAAPAVIGVLADRPAAATAGAGGRYFATDIVAEYISTGSAWVRTSEPAGKLAAFGLSAAPGGWVLAYGQSVLRTGVYADLFAAIGTSFGSADGTHFNLPDLRGRTPVGLDNLGGSDAGRLAAANTLGGTGGAERVTLAKAELPTHAHDKGTLAIGASGSHSHTMSHNLTGSPYFEVGSGGPRDMPTSGNGRSSYATLTVSAAAATHSHASSDFSGSTGNGSADGLNGDSHENMPPYLLAGWAVKL